MSDLIERLRKVRLYPDYDFTHLYYVDTEKSVDDQLDADFVHYDDAATALAEAQAEIARLRDELAALRNSGDVCADARSKPDQETAIHPLPASEPQSAQTLPRTPPCRPRIPG